VFPSYIAGLKALWKKAQKIERKANNSLIINKIIPKYNPFITSFLRSPRSVLSTMISLNQSAIPDTVSTKPTVKIVPPK